MIKVGDKLKVKIGTAMIKVGENYTVTKVGSPDTVWIQTRYGELPYGAHMFEHIPSEPNIQEVLERLYNEPNVLRTGGFHGLDLVAEAMGYYVEVQTIKKYKVIKNPNIS